MKEIDSSSISRLEIIDGNGRSYVNWNVKDLTFSLQDDGRMTCPGLFGPSET